ncbi:MAG: competence type IV pilus minor pilin ComGF [Coprobacillus sp.]
MSLSIVLIITTSMFSMYRLVAHSQNIEETDEDVFIAAKQVSQYVLGTRYKELSNSYTYVDLQQQQMTFSFNNHRLVKTPGFEILLTDIDNVHFEIQGDFIYMNITRNEKEYRFLINKARKVKDETEEVE